MSMSRILSVAVVGLVLLTGSQCRAASNGSSNSGAGSSGTSKAYSGSSVQSSKGKSFSGFLSLPLRAIGVAAGFVVGTPVCAVRKPIDEEKFAINDMTGDSHKKRTVIPAGVFWATLAVVTGALEAPFFAFNNSLVNYDKPFSKEQFSLGKDETDASKHQMDDIHGTSER